MEIRRVETGPADREEICRYMGYYRVPGRSVQPGDIRDESGIPVYADTGSLITRALEETEGILEDRVLFEIYPVDISGKRIRFGHSEFISGDLAKRLSGCHKMILFAATSGFRLDRLIEKYKRMEPSLAYALSMVGTEHTEALLDVFCRQMEEEQNKNGNTVTLRYSPGYGDLPLEAQKDIFRELDLTRRLGVTLNDSMLMTPVKSVTAVAGIRRKAPVT